MDRFPDFQAQVPQCYWDLKEVFNKDKVTSLPPHTVRQTVPLNCYLEHKAMDEYHHPSSSPAGAGFFFVGKKDRSLRPCIDYSPLNEITVKNRYPLPLMSTAFELVQQARWFTKLDLRNAYHLIQIRQADEWKTGLKTPSRHYEYLVMPFGLTNAPAVFQGYVRDVLREFQNDFLFVYLDDILIFSPDLNSHQHHVCQVLTCLLKHHLYAKAKKCEFCAKTVSFLGYIISEYCIQMDPEKVGVVANWPTPTNDKKLQHFLGFANFYKKESGTLVP